MALGLHWEWRGFGPVPSDWESVFGALTPWLDWQEVRDEYLWAPNLTVNIKFREGVPSQEGLKFKRFRGRDGLLEQWDENQDEIFAFPLSRAAWTVLSASFQEAGLTLPPHPNPAPVREATIRLLKEAYPEVEVLTVFKRRQSRLWRSPQTQGLVLVEWAQITSPESIHSVGLEPWGDYSDAQAKTLLNQALADLGLAGSTFQTRNYLDAISTWSRRILLLDQQPSP